MLAICIYIHMYVLEIAFYKTLSSLTQANQMTKPEKFYKKMLIKQDTKTRELTHKKMISLLRYPNKLKMMSFCI